MRRVALPLLALAACRHHHRDTNAPGIADVENPPKEIEKREHVEPEDPGERMFTVNPGGLAGGGLRTVKPRGFGEFGVELTANLGENDRSHIEDGLWVYPQQGVGASIGWSALRLADDEAGDADAQVGPLYAEFQWLQPEGGGGVGYAVDPWHGAHGPQVFAFMASLYGRVRYLWDDHFEFSLGMQIKLPQVWVWSR